MKSNMWRNAWMKFFWNHLKIFSFLNLTFSPTFQTTHASKTITSQTSQRFTRENTKNNQPHTTNDSLSYSYKFSPDQLAACLQAVVSVDRRGGGGVRARGRCAKKRVAARAPRNSIEDIVVFRGGIWNRHFSVVRRLCMRGFECEMFERVVRGHVDGGAAAVDWGDDVKNADERVLALIGGVMGYMASN